MSYQPVTPLGGLAGWSFLNRTMARQNASFRDSADIHRETEYFRTEIGSVKTAADLVANPRLLRVALGAFGLEGDSNKQFFIRKVLEEGTIDQKSMANRLVDKRYAEIAAAFAFDDPKGPATADPGFGDRIVSAFETRSFETAVGDANESFRLALTFQREVPVLAAGFPDGKTGWFRILGSPPLRKVAEGAFGLPSEFAALDIDRQAEELMDRASRLLGSKDVSVFADPAKMETFLRRYLVLADQTGSSAAYSPAASALAILGGGNPQGAGFTSATMDSVFAALY